MGGYWICRQASYFVIALVRFYFGSYQLTHAFTHSYIHSLTHSLTHQSPPRSLAHSPTHSLTHSLHSTGYAGKHHTPNIHSLTHSLTHQSPPRSLAHSPTHSLTHSLHSTGYAGKHHTPNTHGPPPYSIPGASALFPNKSDPEATGWVVEENCSAPQTLELWDGIFGDMSRHGGLAGGRKHLNTV